MGNFWYMFKWHAVEESLLYGKNLFVVSFSVLLGLYYLLSLATANALWPTDGWVRVDYHVPALTVCVFLPDTAINFFRAWP